MQKTCSGGIASLVLHCHRVQLVGKSVEKALKMCYFLHGSLGHKPCSSPSYSLCELAKATPTLICFCKSSTTDFCTAASKAGAISPETPISRIVSLDKDLHPFAEPLCPLSSNGIPQAELQKDARMTNKMLNHLALLVNAASWWNPSLGVSASHLWDAGTLLSCLTAVESWNL